MHDDSGARPLTAARSLLPRVSRRVLGAAAALSVLVVLISLLMPRTWTASGAFRPQTPGLRSSSLAGLAAQFGVSLPLDQEQESPDFYADLLKSRAVLRPIAVARFAGTAGGDSATLIQLFDIHQATPARDLDETVRQLQQKIAVSTGLKTGVITFSVTARSAELAAVLATRILAQIDTFNLVTRQTRAHLERGFTETRVQSALGDLRGAEDRLTGFLRSNRDYRNAPELLFQHDRLERDVTLRQQVYTELVQSLERSRIEEVRDTPVITVVDPPLLPARPDSRRIVLKAIATFLLVVGSAIVWVLLVDASASPATSPDP